MVSKRMSAEEKREKLLQVYHSTKEVMNLKELEKAGSKEGIVMQTIKEVNDGLVSDGLVDTDKIGSSNFYWSFPITAMVVKKRNIAHLEEQKKENTEALADCKRKIQELRTERNDCPERATKLRKLAEERERAKVCTADEEVLRKNDPNRILDVKKMTDELRVDANRWTDNIWAVKKYITQKMGRSGKDADRMLELPDDFDYV